LIDCCFIWHLCLEFAYITCVSLVLRAVTRAAPAAFLSCPSIFSLRFYICCWVNKERKKERKKERTAVNCAFGVLSPEKCRLARSTVKQTFLLVVIHISYMYRVSVNPTISHF